MNEAIEKAIAILNGFYDGDGLPRNVGVQKEYLEEVIAGLEQIKPRNITKAQWVKIEKRELWKAVCIAVAGSDNATSKESMATWADKAVYDYEQRFLK